MSWDVVLLPVDVVWLPFCLVFALALPETAIAALMDAFMEVEEDEDKERLDWEKDWEKEVDLLYCCSKVSRVVDSHPLPTLKAARARRCFNVREVFKQRSK